MTILKRFLLWLVVGIWLAFRFVIHFALGVLVVAFGTFILGGRNVRVRIRP